MKTALLTHWLCLSSCVLIAVAPARADDADSSLDIIHFKAPADWKPSDRAGQPAKVYVSPDSNSTRQTMILIIMGPRQDNLDLRAAFDTLAKQMTQNGKIVTQSDVTATKTRQGFDALSRTLTAQVAGGQDVYTRLVAANVQGRVAAFCLLATSQALYDGHQADMDALLKSVSFTVPANAGGDAAAAKAEYDALEKQKQELLARVAEIEARQKQLNPITDSGTKHAASKGIPRMEDDKAVAAAVDRFNQSLDRRRKPHTILGDILTFDGRPIPNIAQCTVSVGGTTMAAEKTHYNIDVDKNGHYELQVPDGLYTLWPICVVTINGRRVPVDLINVDGKSMSTDQSSAAGIVKDFRLALTALKPDADPNAPDSYCGGDLSISDNTYTPRTGQISNRHPGTRVRFTFTPTGALVDGSKIEPFTTEMDIRELGLGTRLRHIPLGPYRLTVALVSPDGSAQSLSLSPYVDREFAGSADLNWETVGSIAGQRNTPQLYVHD